MTEEENESFQRDLELWADDYLQLDSYGNGWMNLSDAALLAALDNWACGAEPLPPFSEIRPGQTFHPRVRAAVSPMVEKIKSAFLRSIELGELRAKVLQRTFPDLQPLPERTYIRISDLRDCMEMYGLESCGDIIEWVENDDDNDSSLIWRQAREVAKRRAAFRLGIPADSFESEGAVANDLSALREKLKEQGVYIQHLQKELHDVVGDKPLLGRERTTLLNTVGALVELLLPHYRNKQEALIAEIGDRWKGAPGLSESNLQRLVPNARSRLKQSS